MQGAMLEKGDEQQAFDTSILQGRETISLTNESENAAAAAAVAGTIAVKKMTRRSRSPVSLYFLLQHRKFDSITQSLNHDRSEAV